MTHLITLILIISPLTLFLSAGGYIIEKYPKLFTKIIEYMED